MYEYIYIVYYILASINTYIYLLTSTRRDEVPVRFVLGKQLYGVQ